MKTLLSILTTFALVKLQDAQTITINTSQAPDLANFATTVQKTLKEWYPKVSNILSSPNYTPPAAFAIKFETNCNGIGGVSDDRIYACANYYRQHQTDLGSMVTAMTFIVQHYKNCPDWLTQGIADWIRRYNFEPNSRPGPPKSTNYYTDGSTVASYFLQYIVDVSNFKPDMIYWANKDCREGTYSDEMWPRMTGKTLDQHWQTMMNRVVHSGPPSSWQEHWFGHNQNLKLVFQDADVAIYYDNDVRSDITWPFQYIGDLWRYTKRMYGFFGRENKLYAIFHTGKYGGGHPSTYFDVSHDYRNVIDCGSPDPNAWIFGRGIELDVVTHEVAHIVETASNNKHGSPAFDIWGDSKWAEIFIYDVYLGLGRTSDAKRWYDNCLNIRDNYPRPNTAWFANWFYPIYMNYGKGTVLNNFFVLLSKYFPKNGLDYARRMNLGEFVHFWSGAAKTNLKDQATLAFGWTTELNTQFKDAQSNFPKIWYIGGPVGAP